MAEHTASPTVQPSSYKEAGVDVAAGDAFASTIKTLSKQLYHDALPKAAGGYAAIVPVGNDLHIALTTDGVGTKVLVAEEFNDHSGIGVDLVAMCANDLICVGATPTAFLDYYATGKLVDTHASEFIRGVFEGCQQAQMRLVGGETAEMPDVYGGKHYDCAGFAMGTVTTDKLLTGETVEPGQTVIGLASSGVHSNGLSLARKVLTKPEQRQALLTPTRIYVAAVERAQEILGKNLTGMCHVTGGGWRNLFRLNPSVGFDITNPLPVPTVFEWIETSGIAPIELYQTFNMGLGFAIITRETEAVCQTLCQALEALGYYAQVIGKTTNQPNTLTLSKPQLTLTEGD